MGVGDPFTRRWTYRFARSKPSTPGPRSWVKKIACAHDAVSGVPVADTIAYTRLDSYTILRTVSRLGIVMIREMLVVAEEGDSMRMTYTVFQEKKVAGGIAVFERTGIR
jgi:hypothetical protein